MTDKLITYVIVDTMDKHRSYLNVDGSWDSLGVDTHFFSKKAFAYKVLDDIRVKLTTMRVIEFVLRMD